MSAEELQAEEVEVLRSIYEGDDCFKEVSGKSFQYKIGEDGHYKSFLVEVTWTDTYPDELPQINLDAFYNKHINPEVKSSVVQKLTEEAEVFLGSAVTYTVFEYAKENAEDLMKEQAENVIQTNESRSNNQTNGDSTTQKKDKEKKEQLTKAQKRKVTSRLDNKGEKPRGWDWTDVIKHLSQMGRRFEAEPAPDTTTSGGARS